MSSRKMPQRFLALACMSKVESRQQGPPAKMAKLDEILASHCRAHLVTECMKNTLILSGDFRFRLLAENECRFSFSAVNGISFSSVFSFTAENENPFRSASSIHHKKVLVLRCKVLVLVLNTRLSLGLGLERMLKSWSWS